MGSVLLFATLPLLTLTVLGSVMLRLYPRSVPTGWVPRFGPHRETRVPSEIEEARDWAGDTLDQACAKPPGAEP